MLYRILDRDRIGITQPTHAWVSGQLAQAWGNERVGFFAPHAAVCLGAEQHDVGWVPWETAPTLNPATGYPHSFTEVPPEVHTQLWSGAKHLALPMGRYVALLVSLHGSGLYERFTHWKNSPATVPVVEAFLHQEKVFQQSLIAQLQQDPAYAPYVTGDAIARNRTLIALWDALSLAICMGVTAEKTFAEVPTASGETTLSLISIQGDPSQIQVEPWCFQAEHVTLVFEGRVFRHPMQDPAVFQEGLANAPWVTLTATLRPR